MVLTNKLKHLTQKHENLCDCENGIKFCVPVSCLQFPHFNVSLRRDEIVVREMGCREKCLRRYWLSGKVSVGIFHLGK